MFEDKEVSEERMQLRNRISKIYEQKYDRPKQKRSKMSCIDIGKFQPNINLGQRVVQHNDSQQVNLSQNLRMVEESKGALLKLPS